MRKPGKHPEEMTAAELARATRAFDRPYVFEKARAMTAAQRAEERTLRRGRPRKGEGTRKVSISLEGGLLRRADAVAKRRGIGRSELIARFVALGLRRAG